MEFLWTATDTHTHIQTRTCMKEDSSYTWKAMTLSSSFSLTCFRSFFWISFFFFSLPSHQHQKPKRQIGLPKNLYLLKLLYISITNTNATYIMLVFHFVKTPAALTADVVYSIEYIRCMAKVQRTIIHLMLPRILNTTTT